MNQNRRPPTNPMAALASMSGAPAAVSGQNVGQYVTAAMLAAAAGECTCETCRLMARAAKIMRTSLVEEDSDG